MKKRYLFAISTLLPALANARDLTGLVCGPDQEPVPGIEVFFTTDEDEVFSGTTEEDGTFVVALPDGESGEGEITLDPVAVIENGFTRPSIVVANPGLSLQIPMIELQEITPQLSFERRLDGTNCLRFNFDWVAGAAPQTLRTYCVERSQDCLAWTTVMNVGMACPPVEFIDETAPETGSCYYRIRPLEPIFMPVHLPEDLLFIGDPSMTPWGEPEWLFPWPGNVVTINTGEILENNIPIIAPEIRLVPEPDPGE